MVRLRSRNKCSRAAPACKCRHCLGGNVFGWTVDEATSFRLLDAWVEAGLNLVDTADVYSRWVPGHTGGESETIIGSWLNQSGKRDKVVIATKVGKQMGTPRRGSRAAYIRRAVDASLQAAPDRRIDLYQSHKDDPETPLEETLAAFAELIQAGKVRAIGASNFSAPRLRTRSATSERLGCRATRACSRSTTCTSASLRGRA